MAMAAVSCASLSVQSTIAASQASSHSVECSTSVVAQLGGVSSRRRACSGAVLRAGRLSCASSLGGSSLGLQLRRISRRRECGVGGARCESSSEEGGSEKVPFGYTRKDVILIGVGITVFGYGLKYGLEAFGVDSLRAGNAVQITMVAGLTIAWVASYVLRVSNKDMTYAKQLKDYENKVMEKRLEELPEAELESMLAQVEEEKIRLQQRREKRNSSS
ncbi:hypothetical protein KC19_5G161200 [Ceratodon purpureus]|uniref:Uncharacterized protein n=1 Tax=Ceratodon purpureus TaxID=3225 RepID=A0A8T0I4T0_CERPU|nr:hypothetical protein KC19_5G161200 [Ceratodon purpureus]